MKNFFGMLAALVLSVSAVNAADTWSSKDTAPALSASSAPFTGFGVGAEFGGQFTSIAVETPYGVFDGIAADGIVGGVHGEWLFGSGSWRIGPYAEFGLSSVDVQFAGTDLLTMDQYYGAGVKAGVVFNKTLVSVHAGYELQDWTAGNGGNEAEIDSGWWNFGGGVEFLATQNLSIGLDASYLMLNTAEIDDKDIADIFDETEALRVVLKATWRQ